MVGIHVLLAYALAAHLAPSSSENKTQNYIQACVCTRGAAVPPEQDCIDVSQTRYNFEL